MQDVFDFVKIYKERYPKLVINLTEIGKSYQNRAIYVFGITEIGPLRCIKLNFLINVTR